MENIYISKGCVCGARATGFGIRLYWGLFVPSPIILQENILGSCCFRAFRYTTQGKTESEPQVG